MYTDEDNAALYEMMAGWDRSYDFFLATVQAATDVLDVGCGPGQILRRARAEGHQGRLTGVDPSAASLARARSLDPAIEWNDGRADQMTFRAEFDLAFMSANAFMCFVEDLPESLAAIRAALREGGRFVFDTRNPDDRGWERWADGTVYEYADHHGRPLTGWFRVDSVDNGVVVFADIIGDADRNVLREDMGRLRFLDRETLTAALDAAGFRVDAIHGDWHRGPVTDASRSFVVEAVAV